MFTTVSERTPPHLSTPSATPAHWPGRQTLSSRSTTTPCIPWRRSISLSAPFRCTSPIPMAVTTSSSSWTPGQIISLTSGIGATGTKSGDFLLVPPTWTGTPADQTTVIRFPTNIASIVGRWACGGDDDLPCGARLAGRHHADRRRLHRKLGGSPSARTRGKPGPPVPRETPHLVTGVSAGPTRSRTPGFLLPDQNRRARGLSL